METNIQTTILRNLISNEDFTRKVIPFLKKEYFESNHRVVFDSVVEFVNRYNKLPTQEALSIELTRADITDGPGISEVMSNVFTPKEVNDEWLIDGEYRITVKGTIRVNCSENFVVRQISFKMYFEMIFFNVRSNKVELRPHLLITGTQRREFII